ncbi:MAG: hypothetical protein HYY17_10830 [Planctomycetes bacterium]|nr:hypothetical protein [Planctomycetota bacterium]
MRQTSPDPVTVLIAQVNEIRSSSDDREETRVRLRDARTSLAQALSQALPARPRRAAGR